MADGREPHRLKPAAVLSGVARHPLAAAGVAVVVVSSLLLPSLEPRERVAGRSGPPPEQAQHANPATGTVTPPAVDAHTPTTAAGTLRRSGGQTTRPGTGAAGVQTGVGTPPSGRGAEQTCLPPVVPRPSVYFPGCVPAWSGDNGGATWHGVSPTKIVVAEIASPTDVAQSQSEATKNYLEVRDNFVAYLNTVFQLYGRQVDLVTFDARFGDTDPDGACQDVARLVADVHPFAVVDAAPNFALCAADQGIVSLLLGNEFPESFYAAHHPFLWGAGMDCERMGHQLAEYLGKRVAGRRAKWAGDPDLRGAERRLGLYVPDDAIFGPCIKITEDRLEHDFGVRFASVFRYRLGSPDEPVRAVLQFKADSVTSVVLACDASALVDLTSVAAGQGWHPEWVTTGVAQTTEDRNGHSYDQTEVGGHMFGRAEGPEEGRLWGRDGEANQLYRRITGRDLPPRTTGNFYVYLDLMDSLQAAGPRLTPKTFAAGIASRPVAGTLDDLFGPLTYAMRPDGRPGQAHTPDSASREVYWDAERVGYDGQKGTFVSTFGGRFVPQGEWPSGEPPVYPS